MATLTITLPDDQIEFIEDLMAQGAITDPSAYLEFLILQDWMGRNREQLDALLLEGLNSGPATPFTPEDWEEIRREGRERIAARKTS